MIYKNSVIDSDIIIEEGSWYYGAPEMICPNCAERSDVIWYSGDPSVAHVNYLSGFIYAKAAGTAMVYSETIGGSGYRVTIIYKQRKLFYNG